MNKKILIAPIMVLMSLVGCREMYENVKDVDFDVTASSTTVKAGEKLSFNISGNPDMITFWSGEEGHEYAYRDTERKGMWFFFNTTTSEAGAAGYPNPSCVPVAWSSDFSGEYSEEAVRAATWNDISSEFNMPTDINVSGLPSGEMNIASLYDANPDKPIYFRFHYLVNAYDKNANEGKGNERTQWFINSPSFRTMSSTVLSMQDVPWTIVEASTFEDQKAHSDADNTEKIRIRLRSDAKPQHDCECWAVSAPVTLMGGSVDRGVCIKSIADGQLANYSYVWETPGEYTVTFVAINANAYDRKEIIKEVKITVLEADKEDEGGGNEYSAQIQQTTCRVGESVEIKFTGNAVNLDLWTGEKGHDYAYSASDRFTNLSSVKIHFKMLLGADNATQRNPVAIKYVNDLEGDLTETNILSKTWTDVSEKFAIPTFIHGTDTDPATGEKSTAPGKTSPEPTDVGTIDCTEWFKGDNQSCRIAFWYHIDKYDADYVDEATGVTGNGRTNFYLYDMWVKADYEDGSETTLYSHKKTNVDETSPVFVKGSTFTDADGSNPMREFDGGEKGYIYANSFIFRLGGAFKPDADRNSWLLLPELKLPENKNLGPDSPVNIKSSSNMMPETYSYTFATAGTYNLVIVATLADDTEDFYRTTITVTE